MKRLNIIILLVVLPFIGYSQQDGVPLDEISLLEKQFYAEHDRSHPHPHNDSHDHVHSIRMGDPRYSTTQPSPYPTTMTQPNGSQLTVYIKGNAEIYYLETTDGFTVVKDPVDNYYKYAENSNGDLVPSMFVAHNIGSRSTAEIAYVKGAERNLRYTGIKLAQLQAQQIQNQPQLSSGQSGPQGVFPATGNRKALLILIDYPDQPYTYNVSAFDSMTNTVGYNVNGQGGSFRDYYYDASNGILTLTTDVVGWYTADSNKAVYGRNSVNGARPLVRQAVDAAEAAGLDFSQYDGNGDGAVDVVMIIHSGRGMEESGDGDDIWSHRWSLGGNYNVTYDGVLINDYIIQPEALWSSYQIANIGVLCHEFGHALGLPDLYDTNPNNGGSAGLGKWDIMAGGTWNNGGATPGYFSAWCKEQLGWVTPTVLNGSGTVSNMPSKTASYRINTPDANEYFLFETRQKTEWDLYIPGEGLAVYHIISNGTNGDETRKKVDLEAADGLTDMDDQVNSGEQADLFPFGANNSFSDFTNPNMLLHNGTATGSSISNITHSSNLVSFNYSVGGGIVTNCLSQTGYTHFNSPLNTGQSFTMTGCSASGGFFESIEIVNYMPGGDTVHNVTLNIYDGDGFGGNLRYTQTGITISTPHNGNWNTITLQGGVGNLAYTDGSQYTFQLTHPTDPVRLTFNSSDVYTGGNRYSPGAQLGNDLAFKVNVTNTSSLVPTSTLGTENGCVGQNLNIPVNITNGDNIGAISYKITFDTSKLTYIQPTNFHANWGSNYTFTNATTANNTGEIIIGWWDGSQPAGQNFGTSKLFDLVFTAKATGTTNLNWSTITPYGELTDGLGNVINGSLFVDGSVTINNPPTAGLTSSDADNMICAGESVTFTATGGVSYDFKINGNIVQSSASATYTTTTLSNNDVITVAVTNSDGCTAESAGITTTVNALPQVTLTNDATNNEICAGDNITFTANGGDVGATYDFQVNGNSVQSSTSNTYSSTSMNNGDIVSVTVTNSTGCSSTYPLPNSVNIQVIVVNTNPTASLASSDTDNILCDGDAVTFTASGGTEFEFFVNGTSVQAKSMDSTYDATTTTLNNGDVITAKVYNANGCSDSSSAITVTVSAPIANFNVTGGGSYCPGSSLLAITLSGSEVGVKYILMQNGTMAVDSLVGTGSALVFNSGIATSATPNFYTIIASHPATAICTTPMTGVATVTLDCYDVTVTLHYDNGQSQALKNTSVELFNGSGASVGTLTTDNSGQVTFTNIPNGNDYYILADLSGKQYGGINATDALLINLDFVNIQPLTGMKDRAGDVDGNGANNAADALNVANRFVNNPYNYIQDWLHDNDTTNKFNVNGVNLNLTALVLTFGDVNGSYDVSNLNNGTKTNVNLFNDGEIVAEEGTTIDIPFHANGYIEAGAISMVISYPYDVFEIENIVIGNDISAQNLQYTVENGRIRLTWFSLQPLALNNEDILIKIIGKVHDDLTDAYGWTPTITLGDETEFANRTGQIIEEVTLNVPTIVLPNQSKLNRSSQFQQLLYPNPANSITNLEYYLPTDANVTIELFDAVGRQLRVLTEGTQTNGIYNLPIDTKVFESGAYLIKTTVETANGKATYVKQLMIVR
jgi:M6 family metalloprotease-like protein